MRGKVFSALLHRLERHPSKLFMRLQLQILWNLTAKAFDAPGRQIWFLPYERALEAYAAFTKECMASRNANPQRLYHCAFAVGSRIRRISGFREGQDLERLVFFLYRNLKIEMKGQLPGEITVSKCYFSAGYTPQQCRWMSALDSGIIGGIWGGGRLEFTQRLTEGCTQCKACFTGGQIE